MTQRSADNPTRHVADPRSSLRWSAVREVTGLGAIAGATGLVLLLLAGAPQVISNGAALLFLTDLIVWRIASVRLRGLVEHVPTPLTSWQRAPPQAVLVEV